MKKDITNERQT